MAELMIRPQKNDHRVVEDLLAPNIGCVSFSRARSLAGSWLMPTSSKTDRPWQWPHRPPESPCWSIH